VYSRTTTNSSARCVSSPLPTRDLYASSYSQITVMFTAFRNPNLILTPLFPPAPQNALRAPRFPACAPRRPCCLPLAQAILLQARDGGINYTTDTNPESIIVARGRWCCVCTCYSGGAWLVVAGNDDILGAETLEQMV
jgi:hypothetical protein